MVITLNIFKFFNRKNLDNLNIIKVSRFYNTN
jgi:hypothetical protein